MGDVGDYWREAKEHRKRPRAHWHECPHCKLSFGTGTSVAPGKPCRNCGWVAPGEEGSDLRAARSKKADEEYAAIVKEQKLRERLIRRTCRTCGKVLGSEKARADHEKAKHPDADVKGFPDLDTPNFEIVF